MTEKVTDEKMTPERVLALAEHARLGLTEEEARALAPRMERVLEAAAALHEVDTSGVDLEDAVHVLDRKGVLRKDEVGPSLSNEQATAGGPDVQEGFFKVPRLHDQ